MALKGSLPVRHWGSKFVCGKMSYYEHLCDLKGAHRLGLMTKTWSTAVFSLSAVTLLNQEPVFPTNTDLETT